MTRERSASDAILPPTPHAEVDPDRLKSFAFHVYTKLEGAVTAGMIHLGDRLGLFRHLVELGPSTSQELAQATGLHERWVREWLYNQGAARIVEVEVDAAGTERFWVTPEGRVVLAEGDHPAFALGMFLQLPHLMRSLDSLPEAFRSGVGFDYDHHGHDGAVGIERSFEPWCNTHLRPTVIPALEGIEAALERGIHVIDIGCGSGSVLVQLAESYPHSTFAGYDISQFALDRARAKVRERGLGNLSFHDPREDPLPNDASVDLVLTFDCLHDMTRPGEIVAAIRRAISPQGTWLLVDIKAQDSYALNAKKNPMASMMYGISVMTCMSSALSEPGGAGLGTLGLSSRVAEDLATAAGFTRFTKLDIDHAVNAFYEIRP